MKFSSTTAYKRTVDKKQLKRNKKSGYTATQVAVHEMTLSLTMRPWSQLMTEDVKKKTLFVPGSRNMKLLPLQLKRKGKNLKHQTLN